MPKVISGKGRHVLKAGRRYNKRLNHTPSLWRRLSAPRVPPTRKSFWQPLYQLAHLSGVPFRRAWRIGASQMTD
jgi:hypothetical protein